MISWNPKYLYYFTPLIRASKHLSWRFGRKFQCSSMNLDTIRDLIHPGMIVLSRREFQLSNYFIEGYWTHSAMVMPRDKIIEATYDGVRVNEYDNFFPRTDDFILLKPRFCDASNMEKACNIALETIGYPYSFDFNTSFDSFYCSKLVVNVYARACGWDVIRHFLPTSCRQLSKGKIIRPSDLHDDQHAWEVVFRVN